MYAACSKRHANGLGGVGLVQGWIQAMLPVKVCGKNSLRAACPAAIKIIRYE